MNWSVWLAWLEQIWPHVAATGVVLANVLVSIHVVLFKRDSRAAISWMGMVWLVPLLGAALYLLLGINRVQRKAIRFRGGVARVDLSSSSPGFAMRLPAPELPADAAHLASLVTLVERITSRPLTGGNQVMPLVCGDEAYPAMLEAIDAATCSIALSTYIFDNDPVGRMFVEALARAQQRGVAVRVLVDDIGSRYTLPSIRWPLRRAGLNFRRFMPTLVPGRLPYANLRNHRKLLVVDGRIGFTGGLNIRQGHWLSRCSRHPTHDVHYRLEGPVVAHLQEVFVGDWEFSSGELLQGEAWFPTLQQPGSALARGISTGPDYDVNKSRITLLGALSAARQSVSIVTPYFLPDASLVTALNVAALRGVDVNIVLPEANNLRLVKWASTAQLWQVLERGCRVWLSPPPFDHTKLVIVDCAWTMFGSSNWDQRSLRLNFEFDVECYDTELSRAMHARFCEKRSRAREVTLAEVDGRSLPIRLRDGVARLFSPYL